MRLATGLLSAAHVHAPSYAHCLKNDDRADFVGVWDDDVARGRRFAEEHEVRFFEDASEFIAELDAVAIASENRKHAAHVEVAASAGVNVLCEKPIAAERDHAERILQAVEDSGIVFMTAFPCPFAPAFNAALQRIQRGEIGEILAVATTNHGSCPFGWFIEKDKSGGGAMIDHTVHAADLLFRLLQEKAVQVEAQTGNNIYQKDFDDTAMLTVEYESGRFATIDASWSRPTTYKTWGDVTMQIVGEKGVLELDLFGSGLHHTPEKQGNYRLIGTGSNLDRLMVGEFLDAILEGRAPLATAEHGWQATEIALAGYQSAESGQPVSL
ncbi:MAG: Gfo/Idh/MocA family protein [Fimbriimonadaceae bacterium]